MKIKVVKKSATVKKAEKLFLSVKEAVEYSGLSEYAIRKLIADKKIHYVETGKKFLIDREDLVLYLKTMSKTHSPILT